MKLVVVTTSYPRHADDVAGNFVRDAVEHLRGAGIVVEVVSPADVPPLRDRLRPRDRRQPAPSALARARAAARSWSAFVRAARRAARDADLVHAHWLPSGLVAALTGKPFVVQLWGTDVELARRAPWLARPILRRARAVVCASTALAAAARELGAERVEVIPNGVELPADDRRARGAPARPLRRPALAGEGDRRLPRARRRACRA